jgi:hypothetical protein
LRPDDDDYTFERYFLREIDGSIIPNPAASTQDTERALATIELLKLNQRTDLRNFRRRHSAGDLHPFRF